MSLPFERLPRETDKAFAAFQAYLSLPVRKRSLEALAKDLGVTPTVVERWSKKYGWTSRVQAYASHLALVERQAAEALVRLKAIDWHQRQEEQREEEWRVRSEALELARERIKAWRQYPDKCGTLEGIARLLELASKLGRLASGMPTDRTETHTEVESVVRVELDAALDKIYGKPIPGEVVDIDAKALPSPDPSK